MMNLLEAEDTVKGMPDAMLIQQMQNPTGQIPSYLMASELQRRKDMRNRYQAQQQQPTGTVAQQIVAEASAPQMLAPQAPPQMPAPQMPQAPRISPAQMGGIAAVAPGVQRMASGGQVKRMQVGGLTGMPGEGALMGLTIKAKQMARDLGVSFEEAMERLKIQAQMNMPNYNMIAPSGIGFEGLSSLPEDMMAGARKMAGDLGISIGQDPFESFAESAENYLANSPVGLYAQAAKKGVYDVYQDKGPSAASAEAIRATLGGIPALIQTNFEALRKPISDSGVGQGIADFGKQLFSGVPEALGFPMKGDVPPVTPVVDQSEPPKLPAASPQNQGMTGKSVQGTGSALQEVIPTGQQRGIPTGIVDTLVRNAGQQFAGDSSLDMSDLVAQQQRNAVASALMQLGSGIIGRDYGGGAARAAEAFAQGNQAAQDIAMKERVAKYRAAADQRKFDEDVRQFNAQLAVTKERYQKELRNAASEGRNQLFRTASNLVDAMIGDATVVDPKVRRALVEELMSDVLQKYAPSFGVDASQFGRGAASSQRQRSGQDILVQYNAE